MLLGVELSLTGPADKESYGLTLLPPPPPPALRKPSPTPHTLGRPPSAVHALHLLIHGVPAPQCGFAPRYGRVSPWVTGAHDLGEMYKDWNAKTLAVLPRHGEGQVCTDRLRVLDTAQLSEHVWAHFTDGSPDAHTEHVQGHLL